MRTSLLQVGVAGSSGRKISVKGLEYECRAHGCAYCAVSWRRSRSSAVPAKPAKSSHHLAWFAGRAVRGGDVKSEQFPLDNKYILI